MNYLVADFIARLKNASLAHKKEVALPYSKMGKAIAAVLVKEGFLKSVKEADRQGRKSLVAAISYDRRMPIMIDVKVVSKPSLRVYTPKKHISALQKRGLHTLILSTSHGVMSARDAEKKGVGGEVLFEIW